MAVNVGPVVMAYPGVVSFEAVWQPTNGQLNLSITEPAAPFCPGPAGTGVGALTLSDGAASGTALFGTGVYSVYRVSMPQLGLMYNRVGTIVVASFGGGQMNIFWSGGQIISHPTGVGVFVVTSTPLMPSLSGSCTVPVSLAGALALVL